MEELAILILAAGFGKRMKQPAPKVLAHARGKTLLEHVLLTASVLSPQKLIVITGHGREEVEAAAQAWAKRAAFRELSFALQAEQLGTGDAVKAAAAALEDFHGTVLILYGDVPLVSPETLKSLLNLHRTESATVSLISFRQEGPSAYGRIVRDKNARYISKIIEARDCTPSELQIDELNSGIYAVESAFLLPALQKLTNNNAQREYYLTDIVQHASAEGQIVVALTAPNPTELQGINTHAELKFIERILMQKEIRALIEAGVVLEDPNSLFLDQGVQVAAGVVIGPNVQLRGKTKIESGAKLEGSALLIDTLVGKDALIKFGVRAEGAKIGNGAMVGPFAHLRPGSVLGEEVKIGNFVETKNATLQCGAKASHLTYLGDAEIGESANVGAGTITCNYDGVKKSKTIIGEGAFIGSNSALVAPVEIGAGAYVGAGSVITKDVPAQSLAVTRAPQQVKEGWAKRRKSKA